MEMGKNSERERERERERKRWDISCAMNAVNVCRCGSGLFVCSKNEEQYERVFKQEGGIKKKQPAKNKTQPVFVLVLRSLFC